jgi:hypothetical protein
VLSAQRIIEPANKPREIFCPCESIPFAVSALCFAFAAILAFLRLFYDDKGYGFAYWATFGNFYAIAFFSVNTWGIVGWNVTASFFIS